MTATGVAKLVPRIVNELVFPVGCALVLYAAGALTPRPSRSPTA